MQSTQYAIRYTIYDIRYTGYANRRNTPNSAATPNKPPIRPKLSTNYDSIITNKANFPDAQMNVTNVLTMDYENIANSKLCENKPNTKPIKANCRRNLEANSVFKSRKIRTTVIQPKRQISHKIAKMTIP